MKLFTFFGLALLLLGANPTFAQYVDDPNLDQIPRFLRENPPKTDAAPTASVITIGNWDNFNMGTDFAENNVATNPRIPTWFFIPYNTNGTHHTENGWDWAINNPNFGASMAGDPVAAYDSLGNLFYENMYGNITGCKVIKSTTNGATWGTAVNAILGNDKNWIAADQTSGPFANYVYTTMTNNGSGNFARSIDHGVSFQNTATMSPQTLPGMMVCVGPDGNTQGGAVYVVTNSGSSFSSTYTFFKSTDGGDNFTNLGGQQFSKYVGTDVNGRNSVEGMRTRPYPFIAADNSYGPNRGKLYLVYATNDPPGNGNKPDIWCRTSTDGGDNWTSAVKVNDDPNTTANHQWHPGIWCDKETGRLYVMWMDTRDTPTHDSAYIYASYSDDGGTTFAANQQISNKKMKISCPTCGGGGTPRYQGDYNGIASNKKVGMAGWADFRQGSFMSVSAYFPDFAMAIDHATDTLYTPVDIATFQVSIPEVKLYTDTVLLSGTINPVPTVGSITFNYPQGSTITSYPATKNVELVVSGNVPTGTYQAVFVAAGPNGTPVHKRTAMIKVMPGSVYLATATATPPTICVGASSQLNVTVIGGTPPYTYSWAPADSLSDPNIANPVANPSATTLYTITVTDATSTTTQANTTITVNIPPPAPGPITGSQIVCQGETKSYSIDEVATATYYSWSVPLGDTIISGQNTNSITVKMSGESGTISVLAENECGHLTPSVLEVQVNTVPVINPPIHGPDGLCNGASGVFWVTAAPGAEAYNWSFPADVTIIGGGSDDTVHVTWGNTAGEVSVFAENLCGSGTPISKNVILTTLPAAAGPISGKDTVCQNHSGYLYSTTEIPAATSYAWSFPAGAEITAGAGTNSVTVTFGTAAVPGPITVKGINACGEGTASTKNVLVLNCTGIGESSLTAKVSLYPNPVSGQLSISIRGAESQLLLTISDVKGQVRYSERLDNIPAEFIKKLDMSLFAKGVYIVKLKSSDGVYTEKLIVK